MKKLFFKLAIITLVMTNIMSMTSCSFEGGVVIGPQEIIEEAYFEGQKDALDGDVRIDKNQDGCWMWTKSPWDCGTTPKFNPSIVCGNDKPKVYVGSTMKF